MADDLMCNTVTAKAFRLIDSENRTRIQAGEEEGGGFAFYFLDQSGKKRMKVGMGSNGEANVLLSKDDEPRLWIKVDNNGRSSIAGFDEDGVCCFQLDIAENEKRLLRHRSSLRFFGPDKKVRVYLGTYNGEPRYELIDSDGNRRMAYRDEIEGNRADMEENE